MLFFADADYFTLTLDAAMLLLPRDVEAMPRFFHIRFTPPRHDIFATPSDAPRCLPAADAAAADTLDAMP